MISSFVSFMAKKRDSDLSIFRIAHLSDPHLPPPAGAFGWRDLASKRLLSRIAWRRKHKEHQPDVLAALVADIKAYAPDHIAVTGDLTNFASTVEVDAAVIAPAGRASRARTDRVRLLLLRKNWSIK